MKEMREEDFYYNNVDIASYYSNYDIDIVSNNIDIENALFYGIIKE